MKSNIELGFWKGLYNEGNLLKVRKFDYSDNFQHFKGWEKQDGLGIEVGSGLLSMLEFCDKDVVSIDPLMDEYDKIYNHGGSVAKFNMDGENISFGDEAFDFAVNINVIDHTPNPKKMLGEIHRVLKPGGKLYFEVHFDNSLGIAHYILWNKDVVKKHLKNFKKISEKLVEFPSQSKYYAVYKK